MNEYSWFHTMPQKRKAFLANTVYKKWTQEGRDLRSCMLDPDVMTSVYHALSKLEQWLLELIIRKFGTRPFSYEELVQSSGHRLAGASLQYALQLLWKKGILAVMKKLWGERIYYLPRSCFALWHQIILDPPDWSEKVTTEEEIMPPSSRIGLDKALYRFIQSVDKDGWTLTRNGVLPKQIIKRLGQQCTLTDEAYRRLCVPLHQQSPYPIALTILLDFSLRLQLLKKQRTNGVETKKKYKNGCTNQLRKGNISLCNYGIFCLPLMKFGCSMRFKRFKDSPLTNGFLYNH